MSNIFERIYVYIAWLYLIITPIMLISNISDKQWGFIIFFTILDIIIIPRQLKRIYEFVSRE